MKATQPDPRETLVIANVSGGKDSTALSLWLFDLDPDKGCLRWGLCDTGDRAIGGADA